MGGRDEVIRLAPASLFRVPLAGTYPTIHPIDIGTGGVNRCDRIVSNEQPIVRTINDYVIIGTPYDGQLKGVDVADVGMVVGLAGIGADVHGESSLIDFVVLIITQNETFVNRFNENFFIIFTDIFFKNLLTMGRKCSIIYSQGARNAPE
jgi:hypothetical protein